MIEKAPFSCSFDLGSVSEKGFEIALNPTPAERAGIAGWLGIESLESFSGTVKVARVASGRYVFRGHFEADVVQACVVTLDPVPSHLRGEIERTYQIAPSAHAKRRGRAEPAPVIALSDLDTEAPEIIDSPVIDVAAPVLEELSLSLDPYPRKEGVSFTPPAEDAAEEEDNPFSVLKNLKRR